MTPEERAVKSAEAAHLVLPEPEPPATTGQPKEATSTWDGVLGVVFAVCVMAVIFVVNNEELRNFMFRWWWVFALSPVVAALIFVILFPGRNWLTSTGPATRAALFIFVVLPLLLAVVGIVVVFAEEHRLIVLRGVFLVLVCLLPAIMWYLFIATRKASLLNEFLANLYRLGLLQRVDGEDEATKHRRVKSYLQKFEALYGDLRDSIHEDVLQNRFTHYSRADTSGATTLSTATLPVALSTILIAIGWLITLPPGRSGPVTNSLTPWTWAFEPTVTPVTIAFLGAYFFSLQSLFRRYVLKDLGGTAYVAASIRIILALIGIWVLIAVGGETLFSKAQLLMLGFVLGVFPRVIWQIVQSMFVRVFKFAVPSMMSQLPVSDLDGLTVWHEARFEEEDIENIPNMATADLVELLLNTRLPPERIIDWTDQAILYTQLGPKVDQRGPQGKLQDNARDTLRIYGIRTATSLLKASAEARRHGNHEMFEKILTDQKGYTVMPVLEAALSTNSNLKLIQRWRDASPLRFADMETERGPTPPPGAAVTAPPAGSSTPAAPPAAGGPSGAGVATAPPEELGPNSAERRERANEGDQLGTARAVGSPASGLVPA